MLFILRSPYLPSAIMISMLDTPKNSGVSSTFAFNMPVRVSVFIARGIAADRMRSIDCILILSDDLVCLRHIMVIPAMMQI